MFEDDDEFYAGDDTDDFEYYASYIKALEEDHVSKGIIVHELMDEFDLERDAAVSILRRYYAEGYNEDDDEDEYDDGEDEDYGDGNTED